MNQPKVSVIIPVYNVEKYLAESLDSILRQTYPNIEIICVDDGSTDGSIEILKNYERKYPNLTVAYQTNKGAGAARNHGIRLASGDYVYFFDSDDITVKTLIQKAVDRAMETDADMVAFHGYTFSNDDIKNRSNKPGYNTGILKDSSQVFSYWDYPDTIISAVNVVPWNKLIRMAFIRENNIHFEEISSTNDITFSAVCNACAQRIALIDERLIYYRLGHTGTISSGKQKAVHNVLTAVESAIAQISAMPHFDEIRQSLRRFVIDNYVFSFLNYTNDFAAPQAENFYREIQKTFRTELFRDLIREEIPTKNLGLFESIRELPYEEMLKCRTREMIVSFTTYPKRISTIHKIVENMHRQTRKPDKLLLYLAEEQFPEKERELPETLMEQVQQGLVEIRWCRDLRSHKKYHYAMQEYPDSLIVTVDDDLIYPDDMLQNLYHSYLAHPDCVSAMRVHLTIMDSANREIMPYSTWIKEYRAHVYKPSSQLFATSGAGTLFPPQILHPLAFNLEKMFALCPYADDIWLNVMTIINGKRTVYAANNFYLKYLPGTQEETLQTINVENNQNEVQYDQVRNWLKEVFGEDILYNQMDKNSSELSCKNVPELCQQLEYLHGIIKEKQTRLNNAYREKAMRGEEIDRLRHELDEQHMDYLSGKKSGRFAWLKHKLLRGLKCCLDHGVTYTIRRGFGKVSRVVKKKLLHK